MGGPPDRTVAASSDSCCCSSCSSFSAFLSACLPARAAAAASFAAVRAARHRATLTADFFVDLCFGTSVFVFALSRTTVERSKRDAAGATTGTTALASAAAAAFPASVLLIFGGRFVGSFFVCGSLPLCRWREVRLSSHPERAQAKDARSTKIRKRSEGARRTTRGCSQGGSVQNGCGEHGNRVDLTGPRSSDDAPRSS